MNSTPQGPTPEDALKDSHIIRARCAPLSPASGFPVSRSQQEIHETSGLGYFPSEFSTVDILNARWSFHALQISRLENKRPIPTAP